MKFGFAALLLSAFTAVSAVDLRYDNTYDAKGGSLNTVACSDGKNGLITRFGFKTFGDIPTFPNIGAAQAVASWNSTSCGSCWQITYPNTGISIFVTAIDHAGSGFNVAQAAMDKLTKNNAVQLGRVDVTARQVAASNCKL